MNKRQIYFKILYKNDYLKKTICLFILLYPVVILPVNYLVLFNYYLTDKYPLLLRIIPNYIFYNLK